MLDASTQEYRDQHSQTAGDATAATTKIKPVGKPSNNAVLAWSFITMITALVMIFIFVSGLAGPHCIFGGALICCFMIIVLATIWMFLEHLSDLADYIKGTPSS